MRNVPIKVFLIANTQANDGEIRKWLDHVGADSYPWPQRSDGSEHQVEISDDASDDGESILSGAESVIGLAAKRCYMSFEAGLNPNVTRVRKDWTDYFNNILNVGHGCYDADTDVLTKQGWKSWDTVDTTDELATRTPGGVIEYHRPSKTIRAPYRGRMYRVGLQAVDLLVTENHNMLVCPMTTLAGRKKEDYQLVKAHQLGHRQHAYVRSGTWDGGGFGEGVSAHQNNLALQLFGFSIGDGSYAHGRVRFNLRRERKIAYLTNLLDELGWDYTEREGRFTVVVRNNELDPLQWTEVYAGMYTEWSADLDGEGAACASREKQIPQDLLTTLDSESLRSIYAGMMQADGSQSACGDVYDTTSETLAGQFQQLCLHIGIAANVSQAESCFDRSGSYGDKRIYRMQIGRRSLKPEANKPGLSGRTEWIEDWEGDVYCAEVPNNTLYVRRNGKAVWCGNSVLEHATYSFAIEGVSRVFTGEMNRHRAGVAISEGSMRFIRFNDIPWWFPTSLTTTDKDGPILRDKKEKSKAIFAKAFTFAQDCYMELVDLWDMDNPDADWVKESGQTFSFRLKKILTSCFRRVIPMGVATGGVWTINIRALRHILAMRGSVHAEEEIFLVASQMAKLIVEKEPRLMGDIVADEDGYLTPKYQKV